MRLRHRSGTAQHS